MKPQVERIKLDPSKIILTFDNIIQWKILHAVKVLDPTKKEEAALPNPSLAPNSAQARLPRQITRNS